MKGGGKGNDEFGYKVVEFEVVLEKLRAKCPVGSLNGRSGV